MGIKFDGEFTVTSSPADTYAFLADPEKFAPCLPTFKSIEVKDPKTALVKIAIGVGKIRGTAGITLELDDSGAPDCAAYDGKGKIMGGAFNFATSFKLEATDTGTVVSWEGDLSMFGKLVSLAGGLIRPIAKKDIKRLIDALQAELSPELAEGVTD
jgi:carbon monoxide dehydrogenase subunit G